MQKPNSMKKIVLGLSGGADSTTLLGLLLEQGYEAHCCSFFYGSKHNPYENKAAENVIQFYKAKGFSLSHYHYDLSNIFKAGSSALLKSGGDIPEGHYNDDNMKLTVVPGRNLIFASIMASLAEAIGAEAIALGVHKGDHHIYPDCRHEFIKALDLAIFLSTDSKVQIITPLINDDKAGIIHRGFFEFTNQVPYQITRTCYKDQEVACGKCGSCRERKEAFELCGLRDSITYEE